MTDGTIKPGDFRFVWHDDTKKSGKVVWYEESKSESEPQLGGHVSICWKGGEVRCVAWATKGRFNPWTTKDALTGPFDPAWVSMNARFWRALDNAMKAMEKANSPQADEGDASGVTEAWVKAINSGALVHVTDETATAPIPGRQHLGAHVRLKAKDGLVDGTLVKVVIGGVVYEHEADEAKAA